MRLIFPMPRTVRRRLLLCTSLCLVSVGPTAAQAPLTLFADDQFRGACQSFTGAVADLRQTRFGNDRASSLDVAPGCVAVLYRDIHFRGPAIEVEGPIDDMRRTGLGNDRLSSFEIFCDRRGGRRGRAPSGDSWNTRDRRDTRWRSNNAPAVAAVLYRHGDLRGNAISLAPGETVANLRRTQVGNDAVSSLEVAPGCQVILYADSEFRGATLTIDRTIYDMRRTAFGNDRASSAEVFCGR